MKKAYGFVEMKGLASAVVAVDTALKAANVEMEGLEPAKGQGMHTLKFNGEVSSVHAAVSSILGNRELSGKVFSHTVIARPSVGLEMMIEGLDDLRRKGDQKKDQGETKKVEESKEALSSKEEPAGEEEKPLGVKEAASFEEASGLESSEDQKAEMEEESKEEKSLELLSEPEEIPPLEEFQEERVTDTLVQETEKWKRKNTVTCNLCGDPKCLRVKGEPRVKCIHYKEKE